MSKESVATPQFFTTASAAWDAMYDDCANAQISIEFDQYILNNDAVGQRFLTLFADKARAGIKVHLLLDYVGSYNVCASPLISDIIAAGGHVRFYNPLSRYRWLRPAKWFPRNHVKTLLIDSDIAYVGSACLREDMTNWRDTTIRMTGSDVDTIEKQFAWSRLVWWKRKKNTREFRRASRDVGTEYAYFVHRPSMGFNPIYRNLIHAVRTAKQSIYITTPYFLAPYTLRRALKNAAKRGIDVRILMNERSDARIADLVSQSYFSRLIRWNIRISLYQPFMLHAKCVIVDDDWASLGSTNIDYLSLHVNREANMIIRDREAIAALRQHFLNDLGQANPAAKDYWQGRPFWEKILGYLGRSIKGIL